MKLYTILTFLLLLAICAAVMLVANEVPEDGSKKVTTSGNIKLRIPSHQIIHFNVRRKLIDDCIKLKLNNEYVMANITTDDKRKCYIRIKSVDDEMEVQVSRNLITGFTTMKYNIEKTERFLSMTILRNGSVTVNNNQTSLKCDEEMGNTRNITVYLTNTSKCLFYFNFAASRIRNPKAIPYDVEEYDDGAYLTMANTLYMTLVYGGSVFFIILLP
uniref:CPXV218 protein n=1 Tax=Panagrellus redivivus TaxID=6233 RepID=A0A7E4W1R6_PANRE